MNWHPHTIGDDGLSGLDQMVGTDNACCATQGPCSVIRELPAPRPSVYRS
ncbi:hypothetical protein ACIOGT_37185 [Streptomyces microflavus]